MRVTPMFALSQAAWASSELAPGAVNTTPSVMLQDYSCKTHTKPQPIYSDDIPQVTLSEMLSGDFLPFICELTEKKHF